MEDIDTHNKFMVGSQEGKIAVLRPVNQLLPYGDAVNLAAWLVVVTGVSDEEFRSVLDAVREGK